MTDSLPPGPICACGHLKRVHFGDGPCLGAHRNKDGKELDATVCPCDAMTPISIFGLDNDTGHSAVFSPCRTWRYALERRWGSGPFVLFIGLNPSTADENVDDPTIRRCVGFAKSWGMGGLLMGNLFAFRATQPPDLVAAPDPVGPDTDVWLTTMAMRSSMVVAAWGAHPFARNRARQMPDLVGEMSALKLTKDGQPGHPLYIKADTKPIPYREVK